MTRNFLVRFFKCILLTTILTAILCCSDSSAQLPPFGRAMREEFLLKPDYINLNHGAYGTYPKAVRTALHEFQDRIESNADLWIRREAREELDRVRAQLADFISCEAEDLVIIPNTTSGMNAIFRSMIFQLGDKILHFSNVYNAMRSIIQFVSDFTNGTVTNLEFPAPFPMSNAELITRFEEFIVANLPIRLALIDHISSSPAIVQPIDRLIPILRKYNISVLIDGAHAIGQVPINITELAPDYYITNCHKWLYAARGCSMMYVEKSLQDTVHPASISSNYAIPTRYQDEFFWTGTMDYSPYMTVPAAIEFRRQAGGEEAIRNYTHNLAVAGGQLLVERFGTRRVQVDDEQIGSMVDVQLPIVNPDDELLMGDFWIDTLLYRFPQLFAGPSYYSGAWWVRFSAQIYNDLSDFVVAGDIFETIVNEINSGVNRTMVH